ncbi:hypothetical protein Tsubulata_034628 [Turnera subulata]|uniref:C2H2-type domain-containing protein n=1 Tax=Turnera subulata TaxID=218843 RepID=A0A9Q0GCL8_9ROSI|nr:hypothetical protein Tsubulata_034628 [Turnera subulata]
MAMKRSREDGQIMESLDMARCLMLLSHHNLQNNNNPKRNIIKSEIFECKTCNRTFPSFQALGGHRASHKKPKLLAEKPIDEPTKTFALPTKPKVHECSICGLEFALGQALGGHMRKHRAAITDSFVSSSVVPVVSKLPVLKRSNSSKRVFGLDLNLTPLENDLAFLFGKMAPKVSV